MLKAEMDSTIGSRRNIKIFPMELSTTIPVEASSKELFFDELFDVDFFEFKNTDIMRECHLEYIRLALEIEPIMEYNDGLAISAMPPVYVTMEGASEIINEINDIASIIGILLQTLATSFGGAGGEINDIYNVLKNNLYLLFPFFAFGIVDLSGKEIVASQSFFNYSDLTIREVSSPKLIAGRISEFKDAFGRVNKLVNEEANAIIDRAIDNAIIFYSGSD